MNKRIQSGNTDLPDTKMGFHSSKEDEQLVISPAKVILDPEGDSQFFKRKTDSNDNNNSDECSLHIVVVTLQFTVVRNYQDNTFHRLPI